jgi:hypothetical protein
MKRLYPSSFTATANFRRRAVSLLVLAFLWLANGLPVLQAQKIYSNEEKAAIAAKVDSVVMIYLRNSSFTTGGESKYNEAVASELMALFTEDATIFDDVIPKYQDNGNGYPYVLESKSRNDYFRGAFKELKSGIRIRNRKLRVSYDDLETGVVKVYLNRMLEAVTKTEEYAISNNDTVLVKLRISNPSLAVKIASVEPVGQTAFKVKNDADLDGLIDARDECAQEKGFRALKGCPDRDLDGIADKDDNCPDIKGLPQFNGCTDKWFSYPLVLSASTGPLLNLNNINAPEANTLFRPFSDLDPDQSLQTAEVKNPGFKTGIAFNAHIAYYFGKKQSNKNKGVSIGINLNTYEASYTLNNAVIHFKDFDGVDFYRRIITIDEATERVRFNTINIPLMFRYRFKVSRKVGLEFSTGPSFNLFFNRQSTDKVVYDAEGAYAYKGDAATGLSRFDYFQVFNPIKEDYLMLRAQDIDPDDLGGAISASAAAAYANLAEANRNYDFGLNRELSDKGDFSSIETRRGFALNAGLDLTYNIFYRFLFKVGANVIVGRNNSTTGDNEYTFITKNDNGGPDKYNSLFNSNQASTYLAFGVNVGLIIGLFNN